MSGARCLAVGSSALFLAAILAPVVLLGVSLTGGVGIAASDIGIGAVEGSLSILVRQLLLAPAAPTVWLVCLVVSVFGMGTSARQLRDRGHED